MTKEPDEQAQTSNDFRMAIPPLSLMGAGIFAARWGVTLNSSVLLLAALALGGAGVVWLASQASDRFFND